MRTHLPVSLTAVALASLLLIGGAPGRAQTLITGVHTGADGADVTGTHTGSDPTFLFGKDGQSAVSLTSPGTFLFNHATLTGGKGGKTTGLPGANHVQGGSGGAGLLSEDNNTTINSGVFTGGDGGVADGTASSVISSGSGNSGLIAGSSIGTHSPLKLTINGGTFQGGRGADASSKVPGSSGPPHGGGNGGDALSFFDGLAHINGGTFIGGAGGNALVPGGQSGLGGFGPPAVYIDGGTVQIAGGTFFHGLQGAGGSVRPISADLTIASGRVTLYGSGFTFGGVSNYFGTLPAGTGSFSGKLEHNSGVTTISYFLDGTSRHTSITLAPVPEFSSVASFGALLMLGMGGLALKSRRAKKSAA